MVRIVETSVRDGHQSLFATRMTTEEVVELCKIYDKAGYHAIEVWGGATFDSCMRFLNEDPWERLRAVRKVFKDSYSMIDAARTKLAEEEAKRLAKEAGETAWQPFFDKETKPAPLFISPTTEAGLVSHVNDLGRYPIGAGLLYSG